ncbi:TPA: GNAT family N-acetyltransferase [Candidatus Dependentiae bacterium]|nr:MAG: GCN5-related N-acetyltransferase [candidate division TM6 bacterium GW2011_GWE2_31_21]KKP54034.1 MAG: GCN5-related N-acetyltransferase [candidate division TM6 bacterium GW2011_GWF2_33_332]HBS48384.1 GNAT family N-acetyltransferase [Candidatus Dependentiae bacterium]HBZ72942.1 GNAT family N-acetyltransferase [Candidatus Dependentiae bacterium]
MTKLETIKVKLNIATKEDANYIDNKIVEFNARTVPFTQVKPLININYVLKDNDGSIIGGITTTLYCWKVLYINVLWIDEPFQKQGYGSHLLDKVETEAKKLGCSLAHLDTFDFQAKDFYLKHGYEVFGVLDDCPPGHKEYFMKKKLS